MLDELKKWFDARPDLRSPPVIGVLTHIDLLSPAMEWSPPYNWQSPTRPKEVHIRDALAAARTQLGDRLASLVPVCTAAGKVYGVEEALLGKLKSTYPQFLEGIRKEKALTPDLETMLKKALDEVSKSFI